jgi:hypothetical protein
MNAPNDDTDLARRLRSLDFARLQPGMRERAWEEFALTMDLPPAPLPELAVEASPPPAVEPTPTVTDLTTAPPPAPADVLRRLGFTRVPSPPPKRLPRPA